MIEFIAYPVSIVIGIVVGWMLRSPGYNRFRNKTHTLQKRLEECSEQNSGHANNLFRSDARIKELEATIAALRISENIRCENLQNEINELNTRLAETDALLQSGQPIVHALKLKLIEANNTILRYKSKILNGGGQL